MRIFTYVVFYDWSAAAVLYRAWNLFETETGTMSYNDDADADGDYDDNGGDDDDMMTMVMMYFKQTVPSCVNSS